MSNIPTRQDLEIASAICAVVEEAFRQKAAQFALLAEQSTVVGESHLEKIFGTGFTIHGLQILIRLVNQPELMEVLNNQAPQFTQNDPEKPEESNPSPFDPLNLWGEEKSSLTRQSKPGSMPLTPSGSQYMWRGQSGHFEGI